MIDVLRPDFCNRGDAATLVEVREMIATDEPQQRADVDGCSIRDGAVVSPAATLLLHA